MQRKSTFAVCAGVIFLAAVTLPVWAHAQTPAADQARLAAAMRYAKVSNLPKMMNETIDRMALLQPPEKRQIFIDFMRTIDMRQLEDAVVQVMVEQFTTEELAALADFYGTAVGQSVLAKFPRYISTMLPIVQRTILMKARQFKNR